MNGGNTERQYSLQARRLEVGTEAVYLCRERFALQAARRENHLRS